MSSRNRTFEFDEWIDNVLAVTVSENESADLHDAISDADDSPGLFRCEALSNGNYLVSCRTFEEKMILTPSSHGEALKYIEAKYFKGPCPDGHRGWVHAMETD